MATANLIEKTTRDGKLMVARIGVGPAGNPLAIVEADGVEVSGGKPMRITGGPKGTQGFRNAPAGEWVAIGGRRTSLFTVAEAAGLVEAYEAAVAARDAARPDPLSPEVRRLVARYRTSDRAWEMGNARACFALKAAGI